MEVKDSYSEIFKDIIKVLVVLAHPDDAEVVCGGLIARLSKDGKQVRLVVTTNGGKGMQDKQGYTESEFGDSRTKEQIKAATVLGIKPEDNFNLNFPDGEFDDDLEHIEKIVWHVREFKPDLVITHNASEDIINFNNTSYWVNHRDHRKTGMAVLDACYPYSRDRGFFPVHFDNNLTPHTVTKLLIADNYLHPEVRYFDITETAETKKEALRNHPSAFGPDAAEDYLEENLMGDKYFEPLRFVEIY